MTIAAPLDEALAGLAVAGETVTYGDLARHLGLPGPGVIAALAEALEDTMAADVMAGRPLRAALCSGRTRDGLPAVGFFDAARRLGRYSGPTDGPQAAAFVAAERRALFKDGAAG